MFCSTRHVREERVGLEHHVGRPPVGRHAGEVLPVEQHLAGGRLLEAGDHPHQRGLAAARGAEEGEELALVDDEREVVDGDEIAEALGDVAELDEGLRRGVVPRREFPPDRTKSLRRHRYRLRPAVGAHYWPAFTLVHIRVSTRCERGS